MSDKQPTCRSKSPAGLMCQGPAGHDGPHRHVNAGMTRQTVDEWDHDNFDVDGL